MGRFISDIPEIIEIKGFKGKNETFARQIAKIAKR
jgi:hypothetical protein